MTLLGNQLAFDQICVTPDEGVLGQEELPRAEQLSESLRILKDHRDDPKLCVAGGPASLRQSAVNDKTEIEIESIDRHVAAGGSSEV